jgi:succinoglycan biosynthesis transport protein ExoP
MLDTVDESKNRGVADGGRFSTHVAGLPEWTLDQLLVVIRRQRRIVLGGMAAGLVAAVVYIVATVPRYTAVVDILLDTPKVTAVSDVSGSETNTLGFETGGIDSQVELLKSDRIGLGVIKKLDLKKNPAFVPSPNPITTAVGGSLHWLAGLFGGSDEELDAAAAADADRVLEDKILGALGRSLEVKRIGRTYVVELKFKDRDPALAARIANAYAEQYMVDELDAKYDATNRAANWLQDRIAELRERSLDADRKVQKFRADHGLVAVDGRLVDEQQLADANSQLSDARAKRADAEAKAERIEAILKNGNIDAAVTESLANPVIADLRTRYLTASKREAEISKKLGPDHVAAVNLRNDMRQYERLLFEELGRIGESYRSDYQIAKSRLETQQKNFETMVSQANLNNETQVALRDLIRESDTYKTLYETFLQRYQQAIQQQSFPITDARVITVPNPPINPSWPKKPLVLAVGLIVGALLGGALAYLREARDRVFRTGEQVQSVLGLEFLGVLPILSVEPSGTEHRPPPEKGVLPKVPAVLRFAVDNPLSGFAETLRATKVAADIALRGKRPKIIGIVSVMPGEGKTTVAKNFASLLARLGPRTILIDADLRNPGLSRAVAPEATDGLIEVVGGQKSLSDVALIEKETGLAVVPSVVHRRTTNSADLLSSEAMRQFLTRLGDGFDYIVLDFPPLGPVIDVRACAELIDAFVFVVEWGKTERSIVRATLELEGEVTDRCLGIVLNRADQVKLSLYDDYAYRNYSYPKYSKYYTRS